MRRYLWVMMALVLFVSACGGGDSEPTAAPTTNRLPATVTIPPTVIPIFVTPTSNVGGFATATTFTLDNTGNTTTGQTANCAFPVGWQPYAIAAGDTLNVIAASIGSNVDIIQGGNCLINPDTIFIGQIIYLPTLPLFVASPTTAFGVTSFPTVNSNTSNCAIPSSWQPYTVRTGDNLTALALSINSTVDVIQSGNCLANPDAIFVGQLVYLPTSPTNVSTAVVGATATTQTGTGIITPVVNQNTPPAFQQLLRINPTQLRGDGASITKQRTIALDIGVVNDADTVYFYSGTTVVDQNPVLVGIDNDPFDGTSVNYTMADFDSELFFIAIAENEFGRTTSNIVHLVYDPTFGSILQGTGSPVISPALSNANNIYTLQRGASVTVTWQNAPTDAQRIDFYYQPTGGSIQLIGSDVTVSNGIIIGWIVPQALNGTVFGQAIYADRTINSGSITVVSN